jgi:hypothetical protein
VAVPYSYHPPAYTLLLKTNIPISLGDVSLAGCAP